MAGESTVHPEVTQCHLVRADAGSRSVHFDSDDEVALAGQIDAGSVTNRPRLGEVLLDLGIIEPDAVDEALGHQAKVPEEAGRSSPPRAGSGPDRHAAPARRGAPAAGTIDDVALAAALSRQFGVPLADLRVDSPDAAAVRADPRGAGPQAPGPAAEGGQRPGADRLRRSLRRRGDPGADPPLREDRPADRGAQRHRAPPRRRLQRAEAGRAAHPGVRAGRRRPRSSTSRSVTSAMQVDENAPIVQVVNRVVTQGVRTALRTSTSSPPRRRPVRYRIDGAMTEAIRLPGRMAPALASRIKVMAELNIVERRRPQDGQFGVTVDGRPIDVRSSMVPTVHGEKVVLRLLDKTRSLISLNDLGMTPTVAEPYREIVKAPLGMILCTGPTGSGKTTTLYATLTEINDPTRNVVTIEDPVEYQFEGITQMPVIGTGISFADGLRGILRQDPDVILVGEIRDEETARIAMQAALTGHLVLSSLHAVDSVAAVHRFTDMGIEPFLVASAMSGVVGQRLLRRICTACADEVLADLRRGAHRGRARRPPAAGVAQGQGLQPVRPDGLPGPGRRVRAAARSPTPIRDLIVARATHHEIRPWPSTRACARCRQQAFELVVDGLTTVDDVVRSVYAPGVDVDEEAPTGAARRQARAGPEGNWTIDRLRARRTASRGAAGGRSR